MGHAGAGWVGVGLAALVGMAAGVVSVESMGDLTRLEQRVALADRRLAALEHERVAPVLEQRLDQVGARVEQLEAQLASRPELELWTEAQRLGLPAVIGRGRSGLSALQEYRLALAIVREARNNGLDPLLVAAVIEVESSFDTYAVSPSGALGLMQLMPATGSWLAARRGEAVRAERYLFDFERNVELGCAYLAELRAAFGSLEEALLAYNIGPAAARVVLGSDAETRERALVPYARKVLGERERLERGLRQASAGDGAGDPPG